MVTNNLEREFKIFITSDKLFQETIHRANQAALSDAPILILGQTGVGKEVIAKHIHNKSNRSNMPFVPINIASIPEHLMESELFGHEKGAFTGAIKQKIGIMEIANKGTLFIDEVGEIPKSVQVKLLRVLEEKSFLRVGGIRKRKVDFRIITATNRELNKEVEVGNFRADLFFRINVIPLFIPPLRERGDDVVELAQKFLEKYARKYKQPILSLSTESISQLKNHKWPGNVRELKNVIERAVVLHNNQGKSSNFVLQTLPDFHKAASDIAEEPTLDEIQRRYITRVLEGTNRNLTKAAVVLGMKRTSLYKRMKKLGLK